ncbi:MAG: hypothetical protein AAGU23_00460 [Bacillota bacterium]
MTATLYYILCAAGPTTLTGEQEFAAPGGKRMFSRIRGVFGLQGGKTVLI